MSVNSHTYVPFPEGPPNVAAKSNAAGLFPSSSNKSFQPEQFRTEFFGSRNAPFAVAAPQVQVVLPQF